MKSGGAPEPQSLSFSFSFEAEPGTTPVLGESVLSGDHLSDTLLKEGGFQSISGSSFYSQNLYAPLTSCP